MIGAVRESICQALHVAEVLAPSDEDRGSQLGWPTPAAVRGRRSLVAARLRAKILALWERAGDVVTDAGLSALRDDDEGPVVRDLPPTYTLGVAVGAAVLLEELADAVAQDQRYLDGVNQAPAEPGPDVARLIACKRGHRRLAASALPPLTGRGGDAASDRSRTQTRYVMVLRLQALETSLDVLIARELLSAAARGGSPLCPTAASGVRAPPELVTVEQGLRLGIVHATLEIELWFTVGQDASQELLDRLAAREVELRARVEGVGGRVLPEPGEPGGAGASTTGTGVAEAFRLLRARIRMFAQGRVGGEGV